MIKFIATSHKGKILGLGLSAHNRERLAAGDSIVIDGSPLGLPGLDIIIFGYGTKNDAMETLCRLGFDLPSDPEKIHIDASLGG